MTEQLAIWQPNSTWVDAGHTVEGARLRCGCTATLPAGHPRLATEDWPAAVWCPTHRAKAAVSVVLYAQDRGVSLRTHAPEEAA